MKYKKGTFAVIPNITYLKGKPATMQSIFLWLCVHADENGKCFPMRSTIAEESGCDIKTVDKYISQLVEEKFIEKSKRKSKNKRQDSNLYHILLISRAPKIPVPSTNNGAYPDTENGAVTISNELYPLNYKAGSASTSPQKEEKAPYSFIVELEKLGNSKWTPDLIIYNYWRRKGFTFDNPAQFKSNRARSIRAAQALQGYTSRQINETMDYCEDKFKEVGWTLETCGKRIAEVVNKK